MSDSGEARLSGAQPLPFPDPVLSLDALSGGSLDVLVGSGPRVLEIGFGRGELLLASAAQRPGHQFLGVEVSGKRVRKMGRRVQRAEQPNIRLVCTRAELLLESALPAAAFDEVWVHCPDPWPKKRHHRRRFFQDPSVAQLARVLAEGGVLHASTDHAEYAQWISEVMARAPEFENCWAPQPWSRQRPPERGATAYEAEWLAEGRSMAYFRFRRGGAPAREYPAQPQLGSAAP